MKLLEVGYNLVERESIGERYEEFKDRISIIQFLKSLKDRATIPRRIAVVGFDQFIIYGDEVISYVRKILTESSDYLSTRSFIIQFIIDGKLVMDREPKIKLLGKEVRLLPIFGNRLTQRGVDWFYSPFNI